MRRYLGIFAAVLLLIAAAIIFGNDDNQCPPRLARIDSLMDRNPRAAYDSLLHIGSQHVYDGDKAMEMRLLMLKAKAQNKLYLPMPSDTAFNEVVEYYDSNGSANDRMLSRYLLGCIYRDRNDGPKAVRHYLEAAEQADTTDRNCDYMTLSYICGQLATVYRTNGMHREALEAHSCASRFALKADNIYEYVRHKEFVGGCYYALHDTVRALNTAKECIRLYGKYKMRRHAAAACPTIIYTYILQGQYDSARIYIDKFEKESGLFNNSLIEKGREAYYYTKGLYCLRTNNADSARYYFMQLLKYGYRYEAYKGLADYYSVLQVSDSSKIYYELAENEQDAVSEKSQACGIVKELSLYNEKMANSRISIKTIVLLLGLTGIIIFAFCQRFFRTGNLESCKRGILQYFLFGFAINTEHKHLCPEQKSGVIQDKVSDKTDEVEKCKMAFASSANDIRALIAQKAECINELKQKSKSGNTMSSYEWKTLKNGAEQNLKQIYHIIFKKGILSEQEARICVLLLFGFKSGDIAVLTGKSSQRVSNVKAIINKKLFGSTDSKSLLRHLFGTK